MPISGEALLDRQLFADALRSRRWETARNRWRTARWRLVRISAAMRAVAEILTAEFLALGRIRLNAAKDTRRRHAARTENRHRAINIVARRRRARVTAGLEALMRCGHAARSIGQTASHIRLAARRRLTGIAEAIRARSEELAAHLCAKHSGHHYATAENTAVGKTARTDVRRADAIDEFARRCGMWLTTTSEALLDGKFFANIFRNRRGDAARYGRRAAGRWLVRISAAMRSVTQILTADLLAITRRHFQTAGSSRHSATARPDHRRRAVDVAA